MALMLGVTQGIMAEEVLFSADVTAKDNVSFGASSKTEIDNTSATISGGKMCAINEQTSAKNLIAKSSNSVGFCFTNNNTYFKIELDKPLAIGDVISSRGITGAGKDENTYKGIWVSTANPRPNSCNSHLIKKTTDEAWTDLDPYTITEGDGLAGATIIYLYRATGNSTYFDEFTIKRLGEAVTLSFPSSNYNADLANGETSFSAPQLTVNPTAAASVVTYSSSKTNVATVDASTGAITLVGKGVTIITAAISNSAIYQNASASYTLNVANSNSSIATIGYTEAIEDNTLKLKARVLSSDDPNVTISGPVFGSNIKDYKDTPKTVYIDGTAYTNTDSWRKSAEGIYDNQNVGYKLTVAPGYKMNISKVSARIAVADDTYNWYVEILNGAGTQIWKSGEKETKKASSGVVDADVTTKTALQGLTGDITINLYVKQGGSTKYFSINYLQVEATTEVDERPTYAMSVSQNIAEGGEVTPADGSEVAQGESVAFTATPATGYKFVKWVIDGEDVTDNPYTIDNVNATHTAVAHFAKRFKVTYNLGEDAGTITKILNNINETQGYDEVYSDDNDKYTIPAYADKYLYREGNVFNAWQDAAGNTYASGDQLNLNADIELTPTFTSTTASLDQLSAETAVTWSFAKADILFVDWQSSSQYGYYTQTIAVNDEYISVPMKITAGKVGNWGRTDAKAQTNPGTTFTIPAVSGMVVEIANANKEFSTTTIAGSTNYTGSGTKSISYVYEGTEAAIDIVIGESNQYLSTIKVTYPAKPAAESMPIKLNSRGLATFYDSQNAYIIPTGMTASYVESINNNKLSQVELNGIIPADCAVILEGTPGDYTLEPTDDAGTAPNNLLRGSDTAGLTTGEDEGVTYKFYALSAKNDVVGFYWMADGGAAFTNGAHKAYLAIPATDSNASNSAFILDGTDGIESIAAPTTNGPAYNLAGQRVGENYKGVVIVNGKKVMK